MNLGTRVWHQGGRQQPYLSASHMKDITSIDSYHVIIDRVDVDGYQVWILPFLYKCISNWAAFLSSHSTSNNVSSSKFVAIIYGLIPSQPSQSYRWFVQRKRLLNACNMKQCTNSLLPRLTYAHSDMKIAQVMSKTNKYLPTAILTSNC